MPKSPDYTELKTLDAFVQILKNDVEIKELFTTLSQPNFNIYSTSLINRTIAWTNNRALAVYFNNNVDYEYPSRNYTERNIEILCEVASQAFHKDYGESPAQKDSFKRCSDIIYTMKQNQNAQVFFNDNGIQEIFSVGKIIAKSIEPLLIGSKGELFTFISLVTFKVTTT